MGFDPPVPAHARRGGYLTGSALWTGANAYRQGIEITELRPEDSATLMKHLLDKVGALGALIVASAIPCCFLLLAPSGVALGFSTLLPFVEYVLYGGCGVCVAVAMVGSVVAFGSHRHLVWLLFGVDSGLLVIAALQLPWPASLAYVGLLGLAGTAVANHMLVRRASSTVMLRRTAQHPSEKACPSCPSETSGKTGVSLRAD
jgi:hypothetical protein